MEDDFLLLPIWSLPVRVFPVGFLMGDAFLVSFCRFPIARRAISLALVERKRHHFVHVIVKEFVLFATQGPFSIICPQFRCLPSPMVKVIVPPRFPTCRSIDGKRCNSLSVDIVDIEALHISVPVLAQGTDAAHVILAITAGVSCVVFFEN